MWTCLSDRASCFLLQFRKDDRASTSPPRHSAVSEVPSLTWTRPHLCSCCHLSHPGTEHAFSLPGCFCRSWNTDRGHRARTGLCLGGRCATDNPCGQTQLSCSTNRKSGRGKVQGLWSSKLFYPFPLCSFRKKCPSLRNRHGPVEFLLQVCRQVTEDGISGQFWREHSSSCQERAAGACSWAGNCQQWKLSMKTKLC